MEELERLQSIEEHATQIFSLDVTQQQVELEATTIPKDMDLVE